MIRQRNLPKQSGVGTEILEYDFGTLSGSPVSAVANGWVIPCEKLEILEIGSVSGALSGGSSPTWSAKIYDQTSVSGNGTSTSKGTLVATGSAIDAAEQNHKVFDPPVEVSAQSNTLHSATAMNHVMLSARVDPTGSPTGIAGPTRIYMKVRVHKSVDL